MFRYRPIEEAKKHFSQNVDENEDYESDDEDDEDEDKGRLRILEREYQTFLAIAEALQYYFIAVDDLSKAKSMNDDKKIDQVFQALDSLRKTTTLIKGEDAEIIAMAEAKIGIVFYEFLNNTIRYVFWNPQIDFMCSVCIVYDSRWCCNFSGPKITSNLAWTWLKLFAVICTKIHGILKWRVLCKRFKRQLRS